jgi:hypothetical protein
MTQCESIRQCCEGLKKLLASLERTTSVFPYLQDVGQIKAAAADDWPDDRMEELAQRLRELLRTLKTTPAADGEAILSGPRHEKFLGSGTCADF